ncbi:MAG: hypothetical protein JWR01_2924 [Subtercola sp.]|nr:hypothetical protein [Subtercola sp.]
MLFPDFHIEPRDSVRIPKVELEKNEEKESGWVEVDVERLMWKG